MNKKILYVASVIVILGLIGGGGYYYWKTKLQKTEAERALDDVQKTAQSITDSAVQGVMPTINTTINPMKDVPNANPYGDTNPFSKVKINPFE